MMMSIYRVLAIYPAFATEINEMAMVWRHLCGNVPMQCTVVTSMQDKLKAFAANLSEEHLHNLDIYRFSGPLSTAANRQRVLEVARQAAPQIIFCAVAHNMPLARYLQRYLQVPIVLHTEYFLDATMSLRSLWYLRIQQLKPFAQKLFRARLLNQADIILCSNPREFAPYFDSGIDKLRYMPWPHPKLDADSSDDRATRQVPRHIVYIGSFSKEKGADRLRLFLKALLEHTGNYRVTIVGPPIDSTGNDCIKAICAAGRERVEYLPRISRAEALALIRNCLAVISPGSSLGWGLIGDTWNCGTPVIAAAEHYDLHDGVDCLIADNAVDFVDAVDLLYHNADLRKRLVAGGHRTVCERHAVDFVGGVLFKELAQVVGEQGGHVR
jgi:glycosyltransferase involved in cell wall biosynthesis